MEPFTFRKATEKDLQTATALIEQAKVFLWENGVDQWQTGYPNEGAIAGDLQRGEGYVMEAEGQVRGYACISFAGGFARKVAQRFALRRCPPHGNRRCLQGKRRSPCFFPFCGRIVQGTGYLQHPGGYGRR